MRWCLTLRGVVRRSSDPPIKMGRQELQQINEENAERLEKLTPV
jgi:hypothetical protein